MCARGLVFSLLLIGCAPPIARPYAPPSASELIASIRARASALKTLRAQSKIDHMGDGGERVKVKVAMLLERPGKLRFEAESPLGGAVATVVTDGQRFSLLDVRQNRFFTGPALACNVARFTRVALAPSEVVEAMMGGAPLYLPADEADLARVASVSWDGSAGGREVLEIKLSNGGREIVKLSAANRVWDVVFVELRDAAGKRLWKLESEDFADRGGGIRLPSKMDIVEHGSDLEIKLHGFEPNVTIPDGAFHLDPPARVPSEVGDCK